MSNHRDIVLDASLLNLLLIRNGIKTSEIAIGNNLLIYDWISDLVRLNKSFIVKRDVGVRQMLDAARQLSGYIHFAITKKNESVWIAQREGRSKDSDDRTPESLIKMLGISGEGDLINNLKEINIVPVSISYEYDPCDYLKAQEFQLKRDIPDYKSTRLQGSCTFSNIPVHQRRTRQIIGNRRKIGITVQHTQSNRQGHSYQL